jgi:hypothetical protein
MNLFVYQTNSFQFLILDEDYCCVYRFGHAVCRLWLAAWPDISGKAVPQKALGGLLLLVLLFIPSLSLSLCVPIARNPGRVYSSSALNRGYKRALRVSVLQAARMWCRSWNSAHGVLSPTFHVNSPPVFFLCAKTADRYRWTHQRVSTSLFH